MAKHDKSASATQRRVIGAFLSSFLEKESSGGLVLFFATVLALVFVNSGDPDLYARFWHTPIGVEWGAWHWGLSLKHFVDEVLMTLFFLVVGCELKRELVEGELSTPAQARLPAIAALGGMIAPAIVYMLVQWVSLPVDATGGIAAVLKAPFANGWAIPTATDIAFALGLFAFLSHRVPASLKVFLMALAIIDDLGAVLIIGLFYGSHFDTVAFGAAALIAGGLYALNQKGVMRLAPYMLLGALLWGALYKAGIHATLSGVIVAAFLPLRERDAPDQGDPRRKSLLKDVEKGLHSWVVFGILPVFAFANAGVSLQGLSWESFSHPLTLGIVLGLLFGKQLGVFTATWLAVRRGWAALPHGVRWPHVWGMAISCGIGFTMSLFIGGLAFDETLGAAVRLGVMTGSVLSAAAGAWVLARVAR